jgi:hypothetical protein
MRVKHALDVAVRTAATRRIGKSQLCVSPSTVVDVCIVGPGAGPCQYRAYAPVAKVACGSSQRFIPQAARKILECLGLADHCEPDRWSLGLTLGQGTLPSLFPLEDGL